MRAKAWMPLQRPSRPGQAAIRHDRVEEPVACGVLARVRFLNAGRLAILIVFPDTNRSKGIHCFPHWRSQDAPICGSRRRECLGLARAPVGLAREGGTKSGLMAALQRCGGRACCVRFSMRWVGISRLDTKLSLYLDSRIEKSPPHSARGHFLTMTEKTLEGAAIRLSATGPAGPIPHASYCTPQCYAKGRREFSRSCQCKGCQGDAHGRGRKYAFDHGYLKYSPLGPRKPKPGQELLFPGEIPSPAELADQSVTESDLRRQGRSNLRTEESTSPVSEKQRRHSQTSDQK